MSKKKIYIILILSIIAGYIFLASTVNKFDSFRTIKQYFPQEIKDFVKRKIFVYQYQEFLETELGYAEKTQKDFNTIQQNLSATVEKKRIKLIESYKYLNFEKTSLQKNFEIDGRKIKVQSFSTEAITIPKYEGKGTAYLDYDDNNLFVVTANGIFSYVDVGEFKNDSFETKIIKSNIQDLVKYDRFFIGSQYGIKDVLISQNKIFVSYLKQDDPSPNDPNRWKNNCYSTSILVADLNYEFLEFEELFSPNMCIKEEDERYIEYLAHQSGGRISEFKDNKLLFTIGDFRTYAVAQQMENLFGKIISIDFDGQNPNIISMGHRNQQGLFYDKDNNIIFSTEHGPDGGDEVNYNENPGGEVENFGWAISSYGDHHYKYNDKVKDKLFPLYKSHSKYGFIEPLTYFYPSIGISQMVKIKDNNKVKDSHNLLIASMGNHIEEGDLSLHYLKTDKDFKILNKKILPLGERIRDMILVEEHNMVFMFLDTSASIGFFKIQ